MKKLILLLFIFSIFNCKSESEKNKLNSLLSFENTLLKEVILEPDSIITYESEKGLKIKFSPYDLVGYTKGLLKLQLTELNSKQDLLLANAQTISNGKWLISAGAFNLNILNENNNKLSLKKDKTIIVDFKLGANENDMKIFYGEVDNNDMNWQPGEVKIEDKKLYTIMYKDTSTIDVPLTKKYNGILTFKNTLVIDTFGYLSTKLIKTEFTDFKADKDTLRIYDSDRWLYESTGTDDAPYDETGTRNITSITRKQSDSLLDVAYRGYIFNEKQSNTIKLKTENVIKRSSIEKMKSINIEDIIAKKKLNNKINTFYSTIKLPKLGWINIDKYWEIENKETISFNFNDEFDAKRLTLIDNKVNTLLNYYEDSIELPKDRTFTVIAFGLKDDATYGFKKTFRVVKNTSINLDLKKVDESQLEAMIKLR